MEQKHTSGPWEWTSYGELHGPDYDCVLRAGGSECFGYEVIPENDSDARLIAAAPDLLAALQRYVSAYPAFRMKPVGAEGSPARIEQENLMALEEQARAAIAKAGSPA